MSEHTPWELRVDEEGEVFIIDSIGHQIAYLGDMETADRYEFTCGRLMAKAPELAADNRRLREALERFRKAIPKILVATPEGRLLQEDDFINLLDADYYAQAALEGRQVISGREAAKYDLENAQWVGGRGQSALEGGGE